MSNFPLREQDPCKQTVEFFDRKVLASELIDTLNGLARSGFMEIDYSPLEEGDPAYQEPAYHITANRLICACGRKLSYLDASITNVLS